ncbi:histidine phosphatase family protein [Acidaminobacter sp. JC074]|uniref:histidine phosphatase family protein n=1 Tax=Acidaminobacter sp. JC074 TaxID=2530199 RepID=UPI001F0D255C|nr:histidine phosphatase family protein [Acidaminobacter sp. JC074]MCH4886281.1 histidine phosphatase family protein [Acidaminobacter sp. JC074]
MNLILIRHGQSEADVLNVLEGRADFPLTDKGILQVKHLCDWIKENERIDVIFSSTLKRASKTAMMLSEATSTELIFKEELMEKDNGLLAGMSRVEADEKYPIPKGGIKYYQTNAGGESRISFRARVETFIAELINETDTENICVVAHGGTINMILQVVLNLPIRTDIAFACDDTSIHKVSYVERSPWIEYLNKTEHLNFIL